MSLCWERHFCLHPASLTLASIHGAATTLINPFSTLCVDISCRCVLLYSVEIERGCEASCVCANKWCVTVEAVDDDMIATCSACGADALVR